MKRILLACLALALSVVPGVAAGPSSEDTMSVYIGSYAKVAEPGGISTKAGSLAVSVPFSGSSL